MNNEVDSKQYDKSNQYYGFAVNTFAIVEMHCEHGGERAGEKAGENNSSGHN